MRGRGKTSSLPVEVTERGPRGLGVLLDGLGGPEELPRPGVQSRDGERRLKRVGKSADGAVPLPRVKRRHPELYQSVSAHKYSRGILTAEVAAVDPSPWSLLASRHV